MIRCHFSPASAGLLQISRASASPTVGYSVPFKLCVGIITPSMEFILSKTSASDFSDHIKCVPVRTDHINSFQKPSTTEEQRFEVINAIRQLFKRIKYEKWQNHPIY
jgi:hypothetical protein